MKCGLIIDYLYVNYVLCHVVRQKKLTVATHCHSTVIKLIDVVLVAVMTQEWNVFKSVRLWRGFFYTLLTDEPGNQLQILYPFYCFIFYTNLHRIVFVSLHFRLR